MPLSFSVVIATHNRSSLLRRAVLSVSACNRPGTDVLIVDDASSDNTPAVARSLPGTRYFRLAANSGPGPARMLGIRASRHPWVLILDDDDLLLPEAFARIVECIRTVTALERFPVLMFGSSHGHLDGPPRVLTVNDYLTGAVRGDFFPVIQREPFLAGGFSYPELLVGGEHLLWLSIAMRTGIPAWNVPIMRCTADAPERLTSLSKQFTRASEHAELQEQTIALLGPELRQRYPGYFRSKYLGAVSYRLVDGAPHAARRFIATLRATVPWGWSEAAYLLTWIPKPVARRLFQAYRRWQSHRSA